MPSLSYIEIDLILGKKDVAKNAAAEWVSKWTPAVLACAQGIWGKAAHFVIQEDERKYGGIIHNYNTVNIE